MSAGVERSVCGNAVNRLFAKPVIAVKRPGVWPLNPGWKAGILGVMPCLGALMSVRWSLLLVYRDLFLRIYRGGVPANFGWLSKL